MKIYLPHNLETVDQITPKQWAEGMRLHRDRLLAACDWTQVADAPVDRAAWAAYRQALRDFPATWEPGPVAEFPLAPGEVAVESGSSEQSAEVTVEEGSSDDLSDSIRGADIS